LVRHRFDHERFWVVASSATKTLTAHAPPSNLDRGVAGSGHIREEETQSFVGSRDSPPAVDGRRHVVDEARPSATADRGRGLFFDEFGFDEFGEVLTDRVVVEPEMRREFSDVDWFIGVRDIAEDVVASGVAEGARLFLERNCHIRALTPFAAVLGNSASAASRARNTLVAS
jgi:hypothetical protein